MLYVRQQRTNKVQILVIYKSVQFFVSFWIFGNLL